MLLQRITDRIGQSRIVRTALTLPALTIIKLNNLLRGQKYIPPSDVDKYREVMAKSRAPTDISDHLDELFVQSMNINPDTIVELGVRGGESTFVFERVSQLVEADLISVDIEDCSEISDYDRWHFVQADDVDLARKFDKWAKKNDVKESIDVLFIDTSHEYAHTVEEIEQWFPHLSSSSIVFFHDTNLTRYYLREDGTAGRAWDNQRGVIRALEDYYGCEFNEKESFTTIQQGDLIKHNPYCNGMTIIKKGGEFE